MIKVFVADVDGTLTNGIYYMVEDGKISKGFNTRDFHGMWQLSKAGVHICIISASGDPVIEVQCNRAAKYATVLRGAKDKVGVMGSLLKDWGIDWSEVAYIGDDVMDLPILQKAGLAACPSDAHADVRACVMDKAGYIPNFAGGQGAVRDFADYVLDLNQHRRDIEGIQNDDGQSSADSDNSDILRAV